MNMIRYATRFLLLPTVLAAALLISSCLPTAPGSADVVSNEGLTHYDTDIGDMTHSDTAMSEELPVEAATNMGSQTIDLRSKRYHMFSIPMLFDESYLSARLFVQIDTRGSVGDYDDDEYFMLDGYRITNTSMHAWDWSGDIEAVFTRVSREPVPPTLTPPRPEMSYTNEAVRFLVRIDAADIDGNLLERKAVVELSIDSNGQLQYTSALLVAQMDASGMFTHYDEIVFSSGVPDELPELELSEPRV